MRCKDLEVSQKADFFEFKSFSPKDIMKTFLTVAPDENSVLVRFLTILLVGFHPNDQLTPPR